MKYLILVPLFVLTACALGPVGAQTIESVSETAAGYGLQSKAYTLPQLSQLAMDLKLFPNTPLQPTDNTVIANVVSQLIRQKNASLTGGSAVDSINRAIAALNSTASGGGATAATGLLWADLQDVAAGLADEAKYAVSNPSLVP